MVAFCASQLGSLVSGYASPLIHTICYGKVFKRRTPDSHEQVIVMDSASYAQSLTDEHELRIHGDLFDIHSTRKSGGSVVIRATKDEYETHLLSVFSQLRKAIREASQKHSTGKNVSSWLFKLYCSSRETSNLEAASFSSPVKGYSLTPTLLSGPYNSLRQPPDAERF